MVCNLDKHLQVGADGFIETLSPDTRRAGQDLNREREEEVGSLTSGSEILFKGYTYVPTNTLHTQD